MCTMCLCGCRFRHYRFAYIFRYWSGRVPVNFLNNLIKWLWSAKPQVNAMSVRDRLVVLIRLIAFSILIFRMYSPSVHPKYRVKFLDIVIGCILIKADICFNDRFVDQLSYRSSLMLETQVGVLSLVITWLLCPRICSKILFSEAGVAASRFRNSR